MPYLLFLVLPLVTAPLFVGCEDDVPIGSDRLLRDAGGGDDDDDDMTGCEDAGAPVACYAVSAFFCCEAVDPVGACLDACPMGASSGTPASGVMAGDCRSVCGAGPCDPMDVGVDDPSCDRDLGVYWDGRTCLTLTGCTCVGDDCDATFPDRETCLRTYASCIR